MSKYVVVTFLFLCMSMCHAGPAPYFHGGRYNFWIGNRLALENPIFGDEENKLNEVTAQDMKDEKVVPRCFGIKERGTVVLIYCGDQVKSELSGAVWVIKSSVTKIQGESALYCVKFCRRGVPRVLVVDYD